MVAGPSGLNANRQCCGYLPLFSIAFSAVFNGLETSNVPDWAQGAVPLLGAGMELPLWASLALADWLVKLSLALIALVPFRFLILHLVPRTAKNH